VRRIHCLAADARRDANHNPKCRCGVRAVDDMAGRRLAESPRSPYFGDL
jgi:hypothetical protein